MFTTSIGKLLDNRGFAEVILTYQFGFSLNIALALGVAISIFELFLGMALVLKKYLVQCGLLLILMHICYTFLAIITLIREIPIQNCGCFGVFWARPLTIGTVFEDLILVGLSLLFYWLAKKEYH